MLATASGHNVNTCCLANFHARTATSDIPLSLRLDQIGRSVAVSYP